MASSWNRWSRKLHRWGAVITCLPLLLVIASGLLLQIKKQSSWVQPATVTGTQKTPTIQWQRVLAATASVPEAKVNDWSDIDRVDVRPGKGMAKIQSKSRWEVQVDMATGEVLASNYRRSDLIESFHDGSFFSDAVKLWLFLPNGLILLGIWFTGIYLWWLPVGVRRKKARRLAQSNERQDER